MLGLKARMTIIDNTGAHLAECINIKRFPSSVGMAKVGDEISVVIKKAKFVAEGSGQNRIRKGDVRKAVVVRTKYKRPRFDLDGRTIRFDDNACVLINAKKEPIGSRINGVVSADLRKFGWSKIMALADRVI